MATLGELAITLGLIATATATTMPQVQAGLDEARVAGAARYLSSRLAESRMDAIQRSHQVAMRFANTGTNYVFTIYEDGNSNGVLVAWGYTTQGQRVLVAVRLGQRESREDWLDLGRSARQPLFAPRWPETRPRPDTPPSRSTGSAVRRAPTTARRPRN